MCVNIDVNECIILFRKKYRFKEALSKSTNIIRLINCVGLCHGKQPELAKRTVTCLPVKLYFDHVPTL